MLVSNPGHAFFPLALGPWSHHLSCPPNHIILHEIDRPCSKNTQKLSNPKAPALQNTPCIFCTGGVQLVLVPVLCQKPGDSESGCHLKLFACHLKLPRTSPSFPSLSSQGSSSVVRLIVVYRPGYSFPEGNKAHTYRGMCFSSCLQRGLKWGCY
jgi:hypothetical protein